MNEDVVHLLKILEVALIAGIKFVFSPFEAERQGFNFSQALIITIAGGISGILIFSFLGELIAYMWNKTIRFFRKIFTQSEKPKKKFTWLRRFTIKTKMKFGIAGLVILTPLIISIPVGSVMIHRFYRNMLRNIFLLCISVSLWAIILNGIAQYLRLSQYLPQ